MTCLEKGAGHRRISAPRVFPYDRGGIATVIASQSIYVTPHIQRKI
jgi:hypothetical protein